MQTKKELMTSSRARKMYKYFYDKGIPSTICRGTTTTDTCFFYGEAPFWSSYCVGWVKEEKGKPSVCMYCKLAEPPEVLYPKDKETIPEDTKSTSKTKKTKTRKYTKKHE